MPEPARPAVIRTPDQRLRVFVSSTLQELLAERQAARAAIRRLHLSPVMFELGARPHPPRELYRAYLDQSHIFVGIYWERYGWVAPGEEVSGLEDEYRLCGPRPKLIYVKRPVKGREPRLDQLLDRIRTDDTASYKPFTTAAELQRLLVDDLALMLTESFEASLLSIPQPAPAQTEPEPESAEADQQPVEPPPALWPHAATDLVGRDRELSELKALVADPRVRLVTLLGPGGVGKSRLAMALGDDPTVAGRSRFIELAPLSDADLVIPTIAEAVGVPESEQSRLDALVTTLRDRADLLVLDNVEHVVSAATEIGHLLTECPRLTVVATSRIPLRLAAEREFPVSPLAAPPLGASLSEVGEADAVRLFVVRAKAQRPAFTLTEQNRAAVAELVARLDGLPLAIELAAARIKLLSPGDLLQRLNRRFELLAGGDRDAPARQQTLKNTIDWSFNLLSPAEQRELLELSVFAGGWTLDAAEAVCNPEGIVDYLDQLSTLIDHNLVVAYDDPESRFGLLESVREYAAAALAKDPATAESVRRLHADHFAALALEAKAALAGAGDQGEWLARLEAEHENLRAALTWSAAHDRVVLGRLATSLILYWWIRGHYAEGRRWLADALTTLAADDPLRGTALDGLGVLAWVQGDYASARQFYEQSWALSTASGNEGRQASSLGNLGIIALEQHELDRAADLLEQALAINRRIDDPAGLAPSLINLSLVLIQRGQYDQAQAHLEEALAINRRTGDIWGSATAHINLGDVWCAKGELDRAREAYAESLRLAREIDDKEATAYALEGFANVAAVSGEPERAARLWGAAEGLRKATGNPRPPSSGAVQYDENVHRARSALGDETFRRIWAEGEATDLAVSIASVLDGAGDSTAPA